MAHVNMSLRIDAELKDAFMAAAKSMDRNGGTAEFGKNRTLS